jgi:hypothetical protein
MAITVNCDICNKTISEREQREIGPLDPGRDVFCLSCKLKVEDKRREANSKAADETAAYIESLKQQEVTK